LRKERACTATEAKQPPEARYTLTCIPTYTFAYTLCVYTL
jgi:hypothetical protein